MTMDAGAGGRREENAHVGSVVAVAAVHGHTHAGVEELLDASTLAQLRMSRDDKRRDVEFRGVQRDVAGRICAGLEFGFGKETRLWQPSVAPEGNAAVVIADAKDDGAP